MKEEDFMRSAIADANKNKHHFGAVVVKDGKIISKAGKRPVGDPRYHAETQAIFKATKKLNSKHLKGCTLYSTCEPCPMCFYMAWITHVSKIVYGASQKEAIKFGFEEIDVDNEEMNKNYKIRLRLETEEVYKLKKEAESEMISLSELCRNKLRSPPKIVEMELMLKEICKKLKI